MVETSSRERFSQLYSFPNLSSSRLSPAESLAAIIGDPSMGHVIPTTG